MATVQSEAGYIEVFEDFKAGEDIVANTAASRAFGESGLRVVGEGIAEADSGITVLESNGLNGVGRLTVTDEDNHSCGLVTAKMFDVAKNGPLVAEARVQFADLDTKEFFFGFTDVNDDNQIIEGGIMHGATGTLTLTASDLVGFYLSSELTDDEDWHMVYNGGSTTGETTSDSVDANDDAVAGEFQILRLEIDPNGTARWYIDGKLKQTTAGAVSTTVDLAGIIMVHNLANTASTEDVDVDYVWFRANRDWTV